MKLVKRTLGVVKTHLRLFKLAPQFVNCLLIRLPPEII
jgi:hypothetical protein